MKINFYVPVLAMLALMLFSFTTTNDERDYTVKPLKNGNYQLSNVPLSKEEINRIDKMVKSVSFSDKLEEMGGAAKGFWLFRNRKHDENKFTEKTIAGSEVMQAVEPISGQDNKIITQAKQEIDVMMKKYMR